MTIKNVLIAGSLVAILAVTGCSGQASMRNTNPARNLTNSANRAYERNYNNTYGYGYDNYDDYTSNGYYVNDYPYENYANRGNYANDYHKYGRGYNYYNDIPGASYYSPDNFAVES